MKLLTKTSLGLAVLLSANMASASWYVSGGIGYSEVDDQTSTGPSRLVDADYDSDISFNAAVGYVYSENFRIEAEFAYRENDVDSVNFNNNPVSPRGDISSKSIFVNAYYDFANVHEQFVPYVGAGIGFTDVDVDVQYGTADFNGDDDVLAFQLIAGANYHINDELSLYADVRYQVTDDPELNRFGGPAPAANVELDSEYDTYNFNIGVRYNF